MSKKAKVPPPNVHVRIAEVSVTSSLENAFAIIVYELGVFCARKYTVSLPATSPMRAIE